MASGNWFKALLGKLYHNGVEKELRGGLNFVGFDMTPTATGYDLHAPVSAMLSVEAASTGNVVLSGEQMLDGVAKVDGDEVLLWQQSSPAQNGPYIVRSGAWERVSWFDTDAEIVSGTVINVTGGLTYSARQFMLTSVGPFTIGVTAQVWSLVGAGGSGTGSGDIAVHYVIDPTNTAHAHSGLTAVDGPALTAGSSRILDVSNAVAAERGIKLAQSGAWTRPADYDSDGDVAAALTADVRVTLGTARAGSRWQQTAGSTLAGSKTFELVPTQAVTDTRVGVLAALDRAHGQPIAKRDKSGVRYQASKIYLSESAGSVLGAGGTTSDHTHFANAIADATVAGRGGSVSIELESDREYIHNSASSPLFDASNTLGVHIKGTGGDGYCKIRVITGPKRTVQASYTVSNTPADLTTDLPIATQVFAGVGAGLAIIGGDIVQLLAAASGDYVIGVVTAYTGTDLTLEVYLVKGTTARTDWSIIVHDPVVIMDSTNAGGAKGFTFYVEDLTWAGKCITFEHSKTGTPSDVSRPHIEYLGFYGVPYATSGVVPMWTGVYTNFLYSGEIDYCAFANCGRAILGTGGPFQISKITCADIHSPPVRIINGQNWDFANATFEPLNGGPGAATCWGIYATDTRGLKLDGCWFGDDAGTTPAGRYWVFLKTCHGVVFTNTDFQVATAGRACVRTNGTNGLTWIGGYVDAPALAEATAGGAYNYNFHIMAVAWLGTYADAIQNRAARVASGSYQSGTGGEIYTWGVNTNNDYQKTNYGILTGADGSHQAVMGGNYSLYIGPSLTLPTWNAVAGSMIGNDHGNAHGYGTGLFYLPGQNVADAGHNFYGRDAGAAKGQSPIVRISPASGLTQRFGPRVTVPKSLTLANGTNNDIDLSTCSLWDVSGPTAAFSLDSVLAEEDGSEKTIRSTIAFQWTIGDETGTTAVCRIRTGYAASEVLAAPPSGGQWTVKIRYNALRSGGARWEMVADPTVVRNDLAFGNRNATGLKLVGYNGAVAHGAMGATETIDLTAGAFHTGTLDANCTITITTPGVVSGGTIRITQGASAYTITWPTALWPNGAAVQPTTGNGDVNEYSWFYDGTALALSFVGKMVSV